MINYNALLTQRQEEAANREAALEAHFGPIAKDCSKWQTLFEQGWLEYLCNPAPIDNRPTGLPRDETGALFGFWLDDNNRVVADRPSLYSRKFLFAFTQDLVNGGPYIAAACSNLLEAADELDCDQLAQQLDLLAIYLANSRLRQLCGSGNTLALDLTQLGTDAFLKVWDERTAGGGIFICQAGVAIPGKPVIPAEVAVNAIRVVRRQLEERRQLIHTASTTPAQVVSVLPTGISIQEPILDANEAVRAKKLIGLLSFNVQPEEVANLITTTLFALGSTKPLPHESLRAYAIAYALKFYKVIKMPYKDFAGLISQEWGVKVGPRLNDRGPVWDELFEPLKNDVLQIKTNAQTRHPRL